MLGAIIGDIVGSRFEFSPHKSTEFTFFSSGCRFTDDTVLTLATADALSRSGSFAKSYRNYYQRYPQAGYGQRFSSWAQNPESAAYDSYGNGSAMRVAPVAWIAKDLNQALELAAQSAMPTHNHPEGVKGAKGVAAAIFLARSGADKVQISKYLITEFGYELGRSLDEIRDAYSFEVSCQKSVPQAVRAFVESSDFESAVRLAVSLGGDADTQAAIAGSIAEAFYGIPEQILREGLAYLDDELLDETRFFAETYLSGLFVDVKSW